MRGFGLKVLLIAICYQGAISQNLIILQPDSIAGKDCEIYSLMPFSNYKTNVLRGNAYTFDGTPGTQRGLFAFDLSQIPSNTSITYARLSLFAPDSPHTQYHYRDNKAIIQRITSSWSEGSVNWTNQPSVTSQNQVLLDSATKAYQDYTNIDVTAMVRDMLAYPITSFGFMLRLQTETAYRRITFCSSDYPNAAKRPKLEIKTGEPLGTQENERNNRIQFYPNPCSDRLYISLNGTEAGKLKVEVLNCYGQLILTWFPGEKENLNLEGIESQLLFLQVRDPENKIILYKKFVKEI